MKSLEVVVCSLFICCFVGYTVELSTMPTVDPTVVLTTGGNAVTVTTQTEKTTSTGTAGSTNTTTTTKPTPKTTGTAGITNPTISTPTPAPQRNSTSGGMPEKTKIILATTIPMGVAIVGLGTSTAILAVRLRKQSNKVSGHSAPAPVAEMTSKTAPEVTPITPVTEAV